MQKKTYIVIFQFIIYGFKIVCAMIGHNIRSVRENEFPSVVCIAKYDPNRSWQQRMSCTGTLISHHFILTAAHCFNDANYTQYEISMGSHLVELGEKYYPVWWISYEQWGIRFIRPFVRTQFTDDILLVKIFGVWRHIAPSQIGPIIPPNLMYGIDAYMVGCGKRDDGNFPEVMQVATVKIIDLNVCNEIVSYLDGTNVTFPAKFSCSIGVPYAQMYYGDSGGPLIYFGMVIGINIACCPRLNDVFNQNKVNIHLNMERYQNFFNHLVIPDY